jgi:hypothetical protein
MIMYSVNGFIPVEYYQSAIYNLMKMVPLLCTLFLVHRNNEYEIFYLTLAPDLSWDDLKKTLNP